MARRRTARRKIYRSSPRRAAFKRRSSGRSSGGLWTGLAGAFAYGAVRKPISDTVQKYVTPYLGNLFGQYTDEVSMLALDWAVQKYGPRMLKGPAKTGMHIEAAMIGAQTVGPMLSGVAGITTSGSQNLFDGGGY